MKKVLFVNGFHSLSKMSGGASVRSIALWNSLCSCSSVDVISFSKDIVIPPNANCRVLFSQFLISQTNFPLPPPTIGLLCHPKEWISFFFHYLKRIVLFWSPYSYFLKNKTKELIIDAYISKVEYDVIVVRYISTACECGLLKYGPRLIIDVDDDPSEALLSASKNEQNPMIKVIKYVSSFSIKIAMLSVKKGCRHLFFSNPLQVHRNSNETFLHNVSILDREVDVVSFSTVSAKILAVGFWPYYPNGTGLLHFIFNVFPLAKRKMPELELVIAGVIEGEMRKRIENVSGVTVLGFVDEISMVYADSRAVIAPIYIGAGTCVKVVEAMKMKRPVIAPPFAVRGISSYLQDGRDYLLAGNNEEYADKIIEILQNENLNHYVAENAYRIVNEQFSQPKFAQIVRNVICS